MITRKSPIRRVRRVRPKAKRRAHHDEMETLRWPTFCQKYGIDREKEAAAHWAVYQSEKENRGQETKA